MASSLENSRLAITGGTEIAFPTPKPNSTTPSKRRVEFVPFARRSRPHPNAWAMRLYDAIARQFELLDARQPTARRPTTAARPDAPAASPAPCLPRVGARAGAGGAAGPGGAGGAGGGPGQGGR